MAGPPGGELVKHRREIHQFVKDALNDTRFDDSREPQDDDAPGDPACLLRRVCQQCGSVADADPPTTCPQCHADMPGD